MDILSDTSYRSDFRSLLPWEISNVEGDAGLTVSIYAIGDSAKNNCWISFQGKDLVTVTRGDETDIFIFHVTDKNVANDLVGCLKTYGVESE